MHVTFDTNVFGPLVSPENYSDHPSKFDLHFLSKHLEQRTLAGSVSEVSLSLEALDRDVRIDQFFREWATRSSALALPNTSAKRTAVFQRAFEIGLSVLHAPRLALGSFVKVPAASWAADQRYPQADRQKRMSEFMRDYAAAGPQKLKALGAALVTAHGIDVKGMRRLSSWPTPEEQLWLKGIVAEYDNPIQFQSTKHLSLRLRDFIGEWSDVDILASHYGYGLDLFCTLDSAKNAGTGSILHPSNRSHLQTKYNIHIVTPEELVAQFPKIT